MVNQLRSICSRWALCLATLLCAALLAGCAQTVGSFGSEITAVSDTVVPRSLQYIDGLDAGPQYSFTITVPEGWTERYVTRDTGNILYFEYETETGRRAPIFRIEALSRPQFWQQQGSYPGQHGTLQSTRDTYFLYYVPIDAVYSGLPAEEFEALAAEVPDVMTTFEVTDTPMN